MPSFAKTTIILLVAQTLILSSCSDADRGFYAKTAAKHVFKRVRSKYHQRIKPSDSMQAGNPRNSRGYKFQTNSTSSQNNEDQEIYYSDNNEIILKETKSQTIPGDDTKYIMRDGQYVGHYKIGNPYKIFGVSYKPQEYENFEETGVASWYGDAFHGKPTANGETYNMGQMTAAHPTIPLPSLVRVTNLRNNKSVIVRVNDRGPFAKNRVIDLSERAATLLGYKNQGTTEVKIELLRSATDRLLEELKIKN